MNLLLIFLTSFFLNGNTQYAEGNYAEAVVQYQQLIDQQPSAEAYYNLGNAYFKQGELAQSILAYERALRLNPSYKDAQHNLQFAQSKIVDNIENIHSFFLANWMRTLRNALTIQTWMAISISLFVIMLIAIFVFFFSSTVWLRKTAFYTTIFALLISIFACFNARSLHLRDTQREEAIVLQGVVNVKSSPDNSGTDLFAVHEGTKVIITEFLGQWCCIQVGDNIGWMQLMHLEKI
jgi:tetratricopeptide (TPR) repeat protein